MGMVRLVGMSLWVFVWVDWGENDEEGGWKDRQALGVQKERGLLWMVVFLL